LNEALKRCSQLSSQIEIVTKEKFISEEKIMRLQSVHKQFEVKLEKLQKMYGEYNVQEVEEMQTCLMNEECATKMRPAAVSLESDEINSSNKDKQNNPEHTMLKREGNLQDGLEENKNQLQYKLITIKQKFNEYIKEPEEKINYKQDELNERNDKFRKLQSQYTEVLDEQQSCRNEMTNLQFALVDSEERLKT